MKRVFLSAAIAAAAVLPVSQATAHHNANAVFDTTKRIEMTATLKELKNINPHARWFVEVTRDGKKEAWEFESVSPARLRASGIKVKEDLKPGKTFGFTVSPSRDGSNYAFINSMTIDGKKIPFIEI
jgi:hypothetical protein